jgi:MFS family permease
MIGARMAPKFSRDPTVEKALRHSNADGVAFSVQVGAGETYFSAYALFLRASAPQVALISTLPPLLGSLAQLFSAWLGRYVGRKRLVLVGCILQAILWLPILLTPLWFPDRMVLALLVLLILYHGAVNLSAPQWTSIMRDLVSEKWRGRYFGYRTRLTTLTTFVALVAAGVALDGFDKMQATYVGFVAIFLIAFVARAVSAYQLTFLHETAVTSPAPDPHVGRWWASLRETGAIRFSSYFALMNAAVGISAPFFAVYMLRDLELSYLAYMVLTGSSVLTQFLALSTWGRVADIYGNRLILLVTSMALPLVPTLWLISDRFWYLTVIQALSGVTWSGFTLASGNMLYELVPRTRRAAYVALHNVGAASGVFAGAMAGAGMLLLLPGRSVFFGDSGVSSSLLYLFLMSGILRGVIALVFAKRLRDLRKPRKEMTPQSLVMRMTGFSAMLVLLYDFIGRPSADSDADDP